MDVGEVLVRLQGDVTGLTAAVNTAVKNLEQIKTATKKVEEQTNTSFQSIAAAATKIAGVFGAAFGVGALVNFAHQSIEATARINDLAQQTDISAATLAGLKSVAEEAGSSIDLFARAAFNTSRQLSEVATKSDPVYQAIQKLNLNFRDLREMNTEDAIRTIAVAMDQLADRNDKVRVATAFWGSRLAKEIMPVLDGMAHGVDQVNQVLTSEQIARIDQMTDAWTRFKNNMSFQVSDAILNVHESLSQLFDLIKLNMSNNAILKFFGLAPSAPTGKSPLMTAEEYRKTSPQAYTGPLAGLAPPGGFKETTPYVPTEQVNKLADAMDRQAIAARASAIAITSGDAAAAKYKMTQEALLMPLGEEIVASKEFQAALANLGSAMSGVKAIELAQGFQKQAVSIEAQRIAMVSGNAEALRYQLTANALLDLHTTKLPAGLQKTIDRLADETQALEDLKSAGEKVKAIVEDIARMTEAEEKFAELKLSASDLGLDDVAKAVKDVDDKYLKLEVDLTEAWEAGKMSMDEYNQAFDDYERARARERTKVRAEATPEGEAITDIQNLDKSYRDLLRTQQMIPALAAAIGPTYDQASASVQNYTAQIENLIDQQSRGVDVSDQLADAQKGLMNAIQAQNFQQSMKGLTDSIGTAIDQSVQGVIQGTQTLGEAMRNMARNIMLAFATELTKQVLLNPILNVLQGVMGGGTGTRPMAFGGLGLFGLLGGGGGAAATIPAVAGAVPFGERGGLLLPSFQRGGAIPIMAHGGEFVMSAPAVNRIGANRLAAMNAGSQGGESSVIINGDIIPRRPEMTPQQVIQIVSHNVNNHGLIAGAIKTRILRNYNG